MKCVICKARVDNESLNDHMVLYHCETDNSDDTDVDPDYEPCDSEDSESDSHDSENDPQSSEREMVNKPQSSAQKMVKKPNTTKTSTKRTSEKTIATKSPEMVIKSATGEKSKRKSASSKTTISETQPKKKIKPKPTKTSTKRQSALPDEKIVKKQKCGQQLSFNAELSKRVEVQISALPPLKKWKLRKKEHRKRTCNKSQGPNPTQRQRRMCRICSLEVTHLPRHLRDAHDFSRENSLSYSYLTRNMMWIIAKKGKRKYWKCPIAKCPATVQWLQQHLRNVHKLSMADTKEACRFKRSEFSDSSDDENPGANIDSDTSVPVDIPADVPVSHSTHNICDVPVSDSADNICDLPVSDSADKICNLPVSELTDKITNDIDKWQNHPLLHGFYEWLASTEADKTEKSAEQHTRQVFTIWKSIDNSLNVETITDGKTIRQGFIDIRKDLAPGTRKSYVVSLRTFYNYIRYNDLEGSTKIPKLMIQTSLWLNTLSKEESLRRTDRQVQETDTLVTPADITAVLQSDMCRYIYKLFDNANTGEPVMQAQYCNMRNFLIMIILLTNGQRTGAVMNMTMGSIRHATVKSAGEVHIYVTQHKTAKAGPVSIVLNKEHWRCLQIFTKKVWPQLPLISNTELQQDNTCVFLTVSKTEKPKPMVQSLINKSLQSIWVMLKQESNITATKLRKSIVTHVREIAPDQKDALALQMTHRPTTADKFYHLIERKKNAFKTVELITKIMTQDTKKPAVDETQKAVISKEAESSSIIYTAIPIGKAIEHTPPSNFTPDSKNAPTSTSNLTPDSKNTPKSTSNLTTDSKNALKSESTLLPHHTDISKFQPKLTSTPISKETTKSWQSESYKYHGRRAFEPEDAEFLIRTCDFIILNPPITQMRIVDTLSSTERGRRFIDKYKKMYGIGFAKKAADRIQTERKKRLGK